MAKIYEHGVGSTLTRRGLIYKVVEKLTCEGCAFLREYDNMCTAKWEPDVEMCGRTSRKDGKSVIFVKVNEKMKE